NHLLSLEQQYPTSVMVINCEENGKQGKARNIGLSYASADYISFVDADDWLEETAYEKLYRKAIKYNCDAVAAG
ncbi:glycosyltransferase, partial [Acinetobacter sp. 163]|nr:glycosyltransferase [Acinetobacter sp. 163]